MTGMLALATTGRGPASGPPVEEVGEEDLPDPPPEDLEDPAELPQTYELVQDNFINYQAWRMAIRNYIAVAEVCKPVASYRKIQETTGWYYQQQRVFRQLLIDAGLAKQDESGFYWTSTKLQRRVWTASAPYPASPPPPQKAPYPTLDPSP